MLVRRTEQGEPEVSAIRLGFPIGSLRFQILFALKVSPFSIFLRLHTLDVFMLYELELHLLTVCIHLSDHFIKFILV